MLKGLFSLTLFIIFPAKAANFITTPLPGNTGYKIVGSLVESDLQPTGANNSALYIAYQYTAPGSTSTAKFFQKSENIKCPRDKTRALELINSRLAAGVILDENKTFTSRNLYAVFIMCSTAADAGGEGLRWQYDRTGASFPPGSENQPFCTTDIPGSVDFGNVTIGYTVTKTLKGQITCDKDAAVKVSLMNTLDPAAQPGVLKIDDATIRYDVDGSPTGSTYQIKQGANGFNLNFTVADAGKKAATKTGSLILSIEMQ